MEFPIWSMDLVCNLYNEQVKFLTNINKYQGKFKLHDYFTTVLKMNFQGTRENDFWSCAIYVDQS